ncbi:MAG: hypothetical protein CM15mP88_2460 [Pseudomonadota bacterium]|nr:MAG: hypothetical protein CM15mP88_2460 [Pseudomonadota bacterium]
MRNPITFKHYEKNLSKQNKKSKGPWREKTLPLWGGKNQTIEGKKETISNGLEWPPSAQYPQRGLSGKTFFLQIKKILLRTSCSSKTNEHGLSRIGVQLEKKKTKLAVTETILREK